MNSPSRFRIGRLQVDETARRVTAGGEELHLETKAFDLLCYLARHPGQAVSRDELLQGVWGRTVASDAVVAQPVYKLRQVLATSGGLDEAITTIHGKGYRLDVVPEWLTDAHHPALYRTDCRLSVLTVLLIAGLVVWWQAWQTTARQAPRIALLEIENATGDPELDWMQTGGAALMIRELARRGVEVTSPRQIRQLHTAAGSEIEPAVAVAELAGIEQVFSPRLVPDGDGYRLEILSLVERNAAPLATSGSDPAGLSLAMAGLLAERVRAPLPPPRGAGGLDTPFLNEAYARAHHHQQLGDLQASRELYEYILQQSPDYHWARYQLAISMRLMGDHEDARALLDTLVSTGLEDGWLAASVRNSMGHLHWFAGDLKGAREHYLAAHDAFAVLGMRQGVASSLGNLGMVASGQADFELGEAYLRQALAIYRDQGNRIHEARVLHNLGYASFNGGQYRQARGHLQESHSIRVELGLRDQAANSLSAIGELSIRQGRIAEGVAMIEQAMATFGETGNRRSRDSLMSDLADAAYRQGDYVRGRDLSAEYLALGKARNELASIARGALYLGRNLHALAHFGGAEEYYAESADAWQTIGNEQGRLTVLAERIRLAFDRGDHAAAERLLAEMGKHAHAFGDQVLISELRALQLRARIVAGVLDGLEADALTLLKEAAGRPELHARLTLEIAAALHRSVPDHPLMKQLMPVVGDWAPRDYAAARLVWQAATGARECRRAINAFKGLRAEAWRTDLPPSGRCRPPG